MEDDVIKDTPKKRAPRKRTVRRVSAEKKTPVKKEARVRAPRVASRTTKKASIDLAPERESVSERVSPKDDSQTRKAPTSISSGRASAKRRQRQWMTVAAVVILGIGASAAVGYTDAGQIDVEQTIEARNERLRSNNANEDDTLTSTVEVPVQDTSNASQARPLRGLGVGSPAKTPPPAAASTTASTTAATNAETASSSPATASSSEAVASSSDQAVDEIPKETSAATSTSSE